MFKRTQTDSIFRPSDNTLIPADSANTDYQQYLQWLSEGNTPAPPDVIHTPGGRVVSRFQAHAALLQAGLLDEIEAFMGLPETDAFTRLTWRTVQEFNRTSPMVESIGTLFGLTTEQLDDLFVFASTISA